MVLGFTIVPGPVDRFREFYRTVKDPAPKVELGLTQRGSAEERLVFGFLRLLPADVIAQGTGYHFIAFQIALAQAWAQMMKRSTRRSFG